MIEFEQHSILTALSEEEIQATTVWVNAVMDACRELHVTFNVLMFEFLPGLMTYEIRDVAIDEVTISHDVSLWNEHGRNCHKIVHKAILLAEPLRPACIMLSPFAQRMVEGARE